MKQLNMKSIFLVITVLITNMAFAQTWNKKAELIGSERYGAYSFSINNKVYVGGGNGTGGPSKDLYEYDPTTDKWLAKKGMPQNMAEGISFTINGKAYVGLGAAGGSTFLKKLWEYDPTNDSWIEKSELPYFSGVFRSSFFVVNNKAYVLIGTSSNFVAQNEVYEYDPATDTWTQKADFPDNARPDQPFAFAIGDKGYVSCGEVTKTVGIGREVTKKTLEYNPATDKWTTKANFPGDARHMGKAFVYNGKAYCGLGTYRDPSFNSVYLDDFYVYDPTSDSWSTGIAYPGGKLRRATVTVAANSAYIGTGEYSSGATTDWYEFLMPLSISDIKFNNQLKLYPNPSNGIITINSNDVKNEPYTIYNAVGQSVQSGIIPSNKTLDIQAIPMGTYTLQVSTRKGLLKAKIILNY